MTTIPDSFKAYAPAYLERFPHLPLAHRKTMTAICHCQSGHDGHSLSQGHSCGGQHRVNHSCGNRHCPQGQPHKTQLWLLHPLDPQLPGPPCLRTLTVPEPRRPFLRSQPRMAYHALFTASATARKRRAKEERFLGPNLPGFTGIRHTWGRQLQYHPHLHSIGPGGGLAQDRATWLPARTTFLVPVNALAPIYRALFKEDLRQAGLLKPIDPQVWTIPWHVHRQANRHGQTSFTSLAPSVFRVAIANNRIVSLTDRPVTFSYRTPGSTRQRTTHLDAIACIRRCLQHVWPDGFQQVRHCGCMNPRCATTTNTRRGLILTPQPGAFKPPDLEAPQPFRAVCPTCGQPMRRIWRLWTAHQVLLDTG